MSAPHRAASRRPSLFWLLTCGLACLLALGGLTSCRAPVETTDGGLPPGMAFLANAEERTYSEIQQRQQRVLLQIELVDTVRPLQRLTLDGYQGYVAPAGSRRIQFRVVLPSTGLMDSGTREARGFADVVLVAGHRYRVAGKYDKTKRMFHLLDLTTNQPVSPEIDPGFFAPVDRGSQFVPIFIPIKT